MKPASLASIFSWHVIAAVALAVPGLPVGGAEPAPEAPRLVVLVMVDQFRGDYIERWEKLLGEGGFRRLEKEGTWFQNCNYPYASTMTGPGHSSVVTGCSPDRHGIILNDWLDRTTGESVVCVGSIRYERVPLATDEAGKKAGNFSPERLLAPTVADVLKEATQGKARVVSLSLKERSAILMGGRRPDACYWWDTSTGMMVTSTYYRDRVHPWVEAFNRDAVADRWFGKDWSRLRTDLDYAQYSGPDDIPGEGSGSGQGRTFPHPMTGGLTKPGDKFYTAVFNSPLGNELLFELAVKAIDAEGLGKGERPDLMCISFSSNDYVGHCWGPDSQEVLDVTLRTDDMLRRFLDHLDASVGRGRYTLVLSADHGVCPVPELSASQGKDAHRVRNLLLSGAAETFLRTRFGKPGETANWIRGAPYTWVYLNHAVVQSHGLKMADVERALGDWYAQQPGLLVAYGRSQLIHGLPADAPFGAAIRKSFYPDRCGDLTVVSKPYSVIYDFLTGTTHGTPHEYDTHVPLLVSGPGVRTGIRKDAVTPQAIAAILSRALGIETPRRAEVGLPGDLFNGQ